MFSECIVVGVVKVLSVLFVSPCCQCVDVVSKCFQCVYNVIKCVVNANSELLEGGQCLECDADSLILFDGSMIAVFLGLHWFKLLLLMLVELVELVLVMFKVFLSWYLFCVVVIVVVVVV